MVAEQLLKRWGVVFRDLAVHDSLRLPWRDLQWALRWVVPGEAVPAVRTNRITYVDGLPEPPTGDRARTG